MRRLILFLLFFVMIGAVHAQFTYGTTGLLNMPTADMQRDKTFMFGGGFLEKHATPARWTYNTFNYYFDITIFPWLEVSYICTLHKAMEVDPAYGPGFWVPSTYGKFVNQDRNFAVRLRLWKEGWWKPWTPQIVLGANFRFHLKDSDSWVHKAINGVNLMAEVVPGYTDVKEDLTFDPDGAKYQVNLGMEYSFWKDYINAVVELNRCKYFSGGLVFKIHLK